MSPWRDLLITTSKVALRLPIERCFNFHPLFEVLYLAIQNKWYIPYQYFQ